MLSTQAMRDFAVTLYRQLASEQGGMNLFFSPYSLFSTLALALEGARGETARQLGEVLQLPHTLRYHGDEAQAIPWDTQPLHAAMAALNHQLLGRMASDAAQAPARQQAIAELEQEYQRLRQQEARWCGQDFLRFLENTMEGPEFLQHRQRMVTVADALNALRQQLNPYQFAIANALRYRNFKVLLANGGWQEARRFPLTELRAER